MSTAVKISSDLVSTAKVYAKAQNRSVTKQIQHWCSIGQIMEENPDLTYHIIQEIIISDNEQKSGHVSEYVFGA